MQKSTYKQHSVFSYTDKWTFDVFCYGSTIILEVIKRDFFLACCSWRRSANTRCWWLGRNFWLHFRRCQHGLNHIVIRSCGKRTESSKHEKQENITKENLLHQKKVYRNRNLHCLALLNKKREKRQYTLLGNGMYKWDRPHVLVKSPPLFTDRMKEHERTELNFGPQPMLTL